MNSRERFVQNILKLVSIQSFTGDKVGIRKCQEEVIRQANKKGFLARYAANGKVVVIEPENLITPIKFGMVTHIDTVPFDAEKWSTNPLGEVKNGRIYGRGVIDDKGAVVICIEVMSELRDKVEPSWQIIVGSSEEGEWNDMKEYLLENPELPMFMATIDGDGIQNGCRGYLDLNLKFFRKKSECYSKLRLTDINIINGANNVVPSMATAVVDGKTKLVNGKSAHSSTPEKGDNALLLLAEKLKDYSVETEFPEFFQLMGDIAKKDAETILHLKPQKLDEYKTSICPTKCQMVNYSVIEVNLNIRLGIGLRTGKVNDVYNFISRIQREYNCEAEIKEYILPAYVRKKSEEIQLMVEAYRKLMGKVPDVTCAMGVGYNAAFPNCVIFGPRFMPYDDEEDTCHQADENRRIDDLIFFKYMLKKFLYSYLN